LKVLLKMWVPKSDIDGYSKDIFTVLVAKKWEFKKAEAIIKQVKQAKLEKQQIKSTIEWNKNKYTNEQIKTIQTALWVEADWKFGPQTLNAVKSFQANNNLSVDWKIGSGTLGVLW
jgi:peptidoglycan hydrolase-like protein with peptidoglycan-binding domain